MNTKEHWHQIIIRDQTNLTGAAVRAIISPLLDDENIRYVYATDLIGAIDDIDQFDDCILSKQEFLYKVANAVQYDWAFFFFYYNTPEKIMPKDNYREAINNAAFTIRLADDQFCYLYCQSDVAANTMTTRFPQADHKLLKLNELEILF